MSVGCVKVSFGEPWAFICSVVPFASMCMVSFELGCFSASLNCWLKLVADLSAAVAIMQSPVSVRLFSLVNMRVVG